MKVCNLKERGEQGEMADLRAASLETLLQLVEAGFGCTLLPALAIGDSWTKDSGVIARPMDVSDAYRRISLVSRKSFPRRPALDALADIIRGNLPGTVRPIPAQA